MDILKSTNHYDKNASKIKETKSSVAEYKLPPLDIFQETESTRCKTKTFSELIDTPSFRNQKSILSACIGADTDGEAVYLDLEKTPNILIAGTTGSGKSVCIGSIIISILCKAKPDEVKFIMIDPKRWELSIFNNLPHLLVPNIVDARNAAGALDWAVSEMLERYQKFVDTGVSNIDEYNEYIKNNGDNKLMTRIVICIDELADLMKCFPNEIEGSICRLSKSCATGIHLVVTTQRPSPDVITEKIKASISSRIALRVSDQDDSHIILDLTGAEELKGLGDMLYLPLGANKPLRVQGCLVPYNAIEELCSFICSQYESQYDGLVAKKIEDKAVQYKYNNMNTIHFI